MGSVGIVVLVESVVIAAKLAVIVVEDSDAVSVPLAAASAVTVAKSVGMHAGAANVEGAVKSVGIVVKDVVAENVLHVARVAVTAVRGAVQSVVAVSRCVVADPVWHAWHVVRDAQGVRGVVSVLIVVAPVVIVVRERVVELVLRVVPLVDAAHALHVVGSVATAVTVVVENVATVATAVAVSVVHVWTVVVMGVGVTSVVRLVLVATAVDAVILCPAARALAVTELVVEVHAVLVNAARSPTAAASSAVRGAVKRDVVHVLNVMLIVRLVSVVMQSAVDACAKRVIVVCVGFVVGRIAQLVVRMSAVCRLNVRSLRVANRL